MNYVQHIGITAWRKKSAVLLASGLLSLIIFGLQYTSVNNEKPALLKVDSSNPNLIAEALVQSNVKFVESDKKPPLFDKTVKPILANAANDFSLLEQPTREEIAKRRNEALETEQQLGIPYVNLNINTPYIPKNRIVHLDLKGAPPLIGFFKKIFALFRNMGATGVLLGMV